MPIDRAASIARLLKRCGSSRDFWVDHMREFQPPFRHRLRLIVRLERMKLHRHPFGGCVHILHGLYKIAL
jgi:hypothetical protein